MTMGLITAKCLVEIKYTPMLAYADFKKHFIVYTDASTEVLRAVLYQEHDGLKRVIVYVSRGFRNSEKHYPAHTAWFQKL